MTDVSLALQNAIVGRLRARSALIALVPAANIFDRHARPEVFPCIMVGEGQTVREDLTLADNHVRLFFTLHIWTRDGALASARAIAGEMGVALRGRFFSDVTAITARYRDARFLRDPDGVSGHGVLTFELLAQEFAA